MRLHTPGVRNVFDSFCSLSEGSILTSVHPCVAAPCTKVQLFKPCGGKTRENQKTYHDGSMVGVFVNMLVAQVEYKCGSAVEEGQHPDADIKLCWGRLVSKQAADSLGGSVVFAVRNITQILHQPVETQVVSSTTSPHSKGVRENLT